MKETSKASIRREKLWAFKELYFVGSGIDIGCGRDSLSLQMSRFPKITSVMNWDKEEGDASMMIGLKEESFDFVYSSHCLEHIIDPIKAIKKWFSLVKTKGYLIITVPDEDMYEGGVFPSQYNHDHKWTFTIFKDKSWSFRSINILDLVKGLGKLIRLDLIEDYYSPYIGEVDQTLGQAECSIEIVIRK